MKLKRIEIRTPIEYNENCRRVQFYVHAPHKILLTLKQTDRDEDEVFVYGKDLLEANGSPIEQTIYAYVMGITEDEEIFIFEPFQDLIAIADGMALRFKSVRKVRNVKNADRI